MSITKKGNQSYEVLWPTDSANELKLQLIRYNSFDIRWTGYPFTLETNRPLGLFEADRLQYLSWMYFGEILSGYLLDGAGYKRSFWDTLKPHSKNETEISYPRCLKFLTLVNKEIHEGSNFEAFLNTVICRLRVPPPPPPPLPSVKSPSVVGLPTRKQKSASDYNVTPDISSPPATNISIPHNSIYYDVLKLINN